MTSPSLGNYDLTVGDLTGRQMDRLGFGKLPLTIFGNLEEGIGLELLKLVMFFRSAADE